MSMKSKGLLSLITFSDVRKSIFLLLADGPKTLSELKTHFNLKSPEIIPRIKELQTGNMISKDGETYYLTPMGAIIAEKFKPLVRMTEVIDRNENYFSRYKIEVIPGEFLERLDELGEYHIVENTRENISTIYREVANNIYRSKEVSSVLPIFGDSFPKFFTSLAESNVHTSLILTNNVYEKGKLEHSDSFNEYLKFDNARMYVLDDDPEIAFTVTDCFLTLSLINRFGRFDLQSTTISYERSAINWGEDLFEYYKKKAKRVKHVSTG